MRTIELLAKRDDEWLKMAMSFGLEKKDARELTQEMYLRMDKYKPIVDDIMYNDTEVNTFYIYTTLSNLFYTRCSKIKREKGVVVFNSPLLDAEFYHELEDELIESEFIKKSKEIKVQFSESFEESYNRYLFESLFGNIKEDIDKVVGAWYWYDAKLFKLYYDKGMSMRKIASETGISLKSVFNSLKAAKMRLREEFQEDYNKYKKSLEA
tara:strand:+ start:1858 stop:2487 length:630 start_codon:yes stop_codon:yes gene_type:complete